MWGSKCREPELIIAQAIEKVAICNLMNRQGFELEMVQIAPKTFVIALQTG